MRMAISSDVGAAKLTPKLAGLVRISLLIDSNMCNRDADGAGLIGDSAGDGLADPPGGVGENL